MQKVKNIRLTQIHVLDFKGISNNTYKFGEKTRFYGLNGTGKTSIWDAVQVCVCGPGRNGKELIRQGSTGFSITLWCEFGGENIIVNRGLTIEGTPSYSVKDAATGRPLKATKDIIKELFNPLKFTPEDILVKGQEKKILELVDVKITEEEMADLPLDIAEFDLKNVSGMKNLSIAFKKMKDHREELNRQMRTAKGAYDKQAARVAQLKEDFDKKYSVNPKDVPSIEFIREKLAVVTTEIKGLDSQYAEKMQAYREKELKVTSLENKMDERMKVLVRAENEIKTLQDKVDLYKQNLSELQVDKERAIDVLKSTVKPDSPEAKEDLLEQQSGLKNQELQAYEVQRVKEQIAHENTLKTEYDESKVTYDKYAGEEFNKYKALKSRKVNEIASLVPDLKVEDDEKIYWKDVPVDKLSASEKVRLGIRLELLRADSGTLFFLDNIDNFDKNSLKEVENLCEQRGIQLAVCSVSEDSTNNEGWQENKVDKCE